MSVPADKEQFKQRLHKLLDQMNYPPHGRVKMLQNALKPFIPDVGYEMVRKWLAGETMPEKAKFPLLVDFFYAQGHETSIDALFYGSETASEDELVLEHELSKLENMREAHWDDVGKPPFRIQLNDDSGGNYIQSGAMLVVAKWEPDNPAEFIIFTKKGEKRSSLKQIIYDGDKQYVVTPNESLRAGRDPLTSGRIRGQIIYSVLKH